MKKILLIIVVTFLVFQMVVLAADIDIGPDAISTELTWTSGYTIINRHNPANDSGTIKTVEIYAETNMTGCKVATFYHIVSTLFGTRDWESIGDVAAGAKRSFSVNLDVQTGDFIAIYFAAGAIYKEEEGYLGVSAKPGDYISTEGESFSSYSGEMVSIYGTSVELEEEEENALFWFNF